MKRLLLDTNIYGEMILDPNVERLKSILNQKKFIIYGLRIIRDELRAVSKEAKVPDGMAAEHASKNLRIVLLDLYDEIVGKRKSIPINNKMKKMANDYYRAYRELGGSKSKRKIITDFIIVAFSSEKELDIVVSEDEKSMLTENAIRAYKIVNGTLEKRTPKFIGYGDFKKLLI